MCARCARGLRGGGGQTLIDRGREGEGPRALPPPRRTDSGRALPSLPTHEHGETPRDSHRTAPIALVLVLVHVLVLLRFVAASPAVLVSAATIITTIPLVSGTVMTREDGEVVGEPVGDHLEPVGAAAGRGGQQVPPAHPGAPGPR